MALVTAVLLIGLGAFVIQDTTEEFEDATAQDAMIEFDEEITELTGDTTNASTEFEFPTDSTESISTSAADGQVRITVESTADPDVIEEAGRSTYEFDLGTITHEAQDGTLTAYQGGGVWTVADDSVRPTTSPALDFDGTAIDFSFVSISEIETPSDLRAMNVDRDGAESSELYDEFLEEVADHWRVQGSEGTAPVDVTIEIESEFAAGWATYMQNDATAPLDAQQVTLDDDSVTFELVSVGSAFEFDTSSEKFPDGVSYSGLADYLPYNSAVTASDGSPTVELDGSDSVAIFDVESEQWVRHSNPWEAVQSGDSIPEDELPGEHLGGNRYEFADGAAVCVIEAGGDIEDCNERLFGVLDDDITNLKQFEGAFETAILGVENADSPGEPIHADEDTVAIETSVTNTGFVTDSQEVVVQAPDGTVLAREPIDSLPPGETEGRTIEWEPPYTAAGVDELSVSSTGDGTGATVDTTIHSPDPAFSVDIGAIDNTAVGQTLTVEAEVTNDGRSGSGEIWLETDEGHLPDGYIADSEPIEDLSSGESETLTLEWPLFRGDSGETTVTVRSEDDVSSTLVDITRGVLFAGPATHSDAPFLHDEYVTADQLESSDDAEAGYPLDSAVHETYELYVWDDGGNGWENVEATGIREYDEPVMDSVETTYENRDDLPAAPIEYTHYEIEQNAPVCVVHTRSELSIDDACGEVAVDEHIGTAGDGLEIGADEATATLLTAQVDAKVEETSTQVRDPIDIVHTVGQSGSLIDDDYSTNWPHSGPIEKTDQLVESSVTELAELELVSFIPGSLDIAVRGVYEDADCSENAWDDLTPWDSILTGDPCPVDNADLDGGTGYHTPIGQLDDFDFTNHRQTVYAYDETAQLWRPAATHLDDNNVYYVDIRGREDVYLYDVPEDTDVRVHYDSALSDWFLVGDWIDSEVDLVAQDPDKYRFWAATDQLASLDGADDRGGLVTFNKDAEEQAPLQDTDQLAETLWWDEDDLATELHESIEADDRLDVYQGLVEAEDTFDQQDGDREEFVVIVSNGVHDPHGEPTGNVYQSSKDTMAIHKAAQLGDDDRMVYTVGLGPHADQWLLETIADESGGEFRSAMTADELPTIFDEIASDIVDDGEDALERDYTTLTVAIDGSELSLDFGLLGEKNVNDPTVYNQDDSEARSLTIDEFGEGVETLTLDMAVAGCREARDSGVTATVDSDLFPYSECEEPGEEVEHTVTSGDGGYQVYMDGETPGNTVTADWQQSIDELDTVQPYWDDTAGEFDLESHEAIIAIDARNHNAYDGYALVLVQTADELTMQNFEWERPVLQTEFEVDIVDSSHTVSDSDGLLKADEGETIQTTVNVTNFGESGTETVSLMDDTTSRAEPDSVRDSESLFLEADEHTEIELEWETRTGDGILDGTPYLDDERRTLQARSYTDINGNNTAIRQPESRLEIESIDGEPAMLAAFEDATMAVTVRNTGHADIESGDSKYLWLEHADEVVAVGTFDPVATGEATQVSLEWAVRPSQLPSGETESEFTIRTATDSETTVLDLADEDRGLQRAIQQIDETIPIEFTLDSIELSS